MAWPAAVIGGCDRDHDDRDDGDDDVEVNGAGRWPAATGGSLRRRLGRGSKSAWTPERGVAGTDDFELFTDDAARLADWRERAAAFLARRRRSLHPEKTHVARTAAPATFLGFELRPGGCRRTGAPVPQPPEGGSVALTFDRCGKRRNRAAGSTAYGWGESRPFGATYRLPTEEEWDRGGRRDTGKDQM